MKKKIISEKTEVLAPRPAMSLESRENQIAAAAMDLVEKRILEGTATSQETCYFLKIGSSRERMERELLKRELELKQAKTEAIESAKKVEELYANAINAFKTYVGGTSEE